MSLFDQNNRPLRPPPIPPSSPGYSGQVDDSIDWRLMIKLFWILVIAPINIFIGAQLLGYEFGFEDYKLMSISKPAECRIETLKRGPYMDDGFTVEIPHSGDYEICKKAFLWRFDQ